MLGRREPQRGTPSGFFLRDPQTTMGLLARQPCRCSAAKQSDLRYPLGTVAAHLRSLSVQWPGDHRGGWAGWDSRRVTVL